MTIITTIIADDHPTFRLGLKMVLQKDADFQVIGEAATGQAAIQLAAEVHPMFIVMDINMPGVSGVEATREIMRQNPESRILMMTMFEESDVIAQAICAGAHGYLLKNAEPDEILRAARGVANGDIIFSQAIAVKLIDILAHPPRATLLPAHFPQLTDRERDVLNLIAQGQNNAAIADRLVLSEKTVRNYVSIIFDKLQVVDRSQAILKAREAGLG